MLAGTFAVGLGAPLARAADLKSIKFVVDFTYQGDHAIWALPLANGGFKKNGLDVSMSRGYGSGDTIVKVASGAYDIGFADISAVVKFNADNPTKRVIGVMQVFNHTLCAIISLSKNGIHKPADLVGKTIGDASFDASRILFPAFAQANHIDPSKVNWKNIAPDLRETILVQGQVQAIGGFTSTSLFNLMHIGVKREDIVLLKYADNGVDLYGNAVIVREDYLKQHPERTRAFVMTTIEGTKQAIKDPKAGMLAMQKLDPLFNVDLELARWKYVVAQTILTPEVEKHGYGYVDPARMKQTIEANALSYGIKTPPTLAEMYTSSLLPPKAQRMLKA